MASNRNLPDGGRYTRPRRGYRSRSNYRNRLAKRRLTGSEVRMPSLEVLRKRQNSEAKNG
jgi:hypothetical protein